jgi:GH35 family endo-1,4-beta-xylanase
MSGDAYAHRKARIRLRFEQRDGTPLAKQRVTVNQTRQEFLFGVGGFDALELAGGNQDGTALEEERRAGLQTRMDTLFSLCNYATLPFYWGRYEAEEGKPDQARTLAAARWYAERGIVTKGHPLCWHTVCAPWLMRYGNDVILQKLLKRIEREVTAFKGLIDTWDVVNEAVIMSSFDKYDNAITRLSEDFGRVGVVREAFDAARRANPGAVFLLNDFDISSNYEILIDSCLDAGVHLDAIGIQSHQHQGYWGPEKLQAVLERFSQFGIPLHFTENTIISGDLMPSHIVDLNDWQASAWPSTPEGEERQAHEVLELYETLFAHPAVKAITTWDAVDGKWLCAPSGLLRADNSVKPVYEALMRKIKGEWLTSQALITGEHGEVGFYGFRGDYTAAFNGREARFTLDGTRHKVTITI